MAQEHGFKRAENGTIGEYRTKTFLIDRFWILERSVDIDGADFLIQRKFPHHHILDDLPPRFGIIQSKFSQDVKTYHKLNKDYVFDSSGNPHIEFFLIVNIGFEDSQKMCLASAQDIIENFKIDSNNHFIISTQKLLKSFEVVNKNRTLTRIEKSIQCADFYKNRMYVFSELRKFSPDFNAIHPDFIYEIDYCDGNVSEIFIEQKNDAYQCILEIENLHEQLVKFVTETNPIEACRISEDIKYNYKSIRIPELFNENFYWKSKSYLRQIQDLKNDGILDVYLNLKSQILVNVNNFLSSNLDKINLESQIIISIDYNPNDYSDFTIANEITYALEQSSEYIKFITAQEGKLIVSNFIGKHFAAQFPIIPLNEVVVYAIMEKIYRLKYFVN